MDRNTKATYKRGAWVVLPITLFIGCRVGLRACVSASRSHSDYASTRPLEIAPPELPTSTAPRPKVTTPADGFAVHDIATAQALPDDLVTNGKEIAWLRLRSGEVAVSAAGAAAKVIAHDQKLVRRRHAQGLALSATHAYWITSEAVMRAPLDGSAEPETVVEHVSGLTVIALDKDDVYYGVSRPVMEESDAGVASGVYLLEPKKKPRLVFEGDSPCGVAVDAKAMYVIEEMGIWRIPKTGRVTDKSGHKQIAPPEERTGCSIAVDDDQVYWTAPSSDLFVRAKKLTGADRANVRVTKRPYNVVIDRGYAYVLTETSSAGFGELGSIYKIAVRADATSETAQPKAIMNDRAGLNGLAVSLGSIYFAAYNDAELDGTVAGLREADPK